MFSSKESAYQYRRGGFNPWVRKIPWRRKQQPTLVFLPEKSHEHRSLAGYSPRICERVRYNLATKQQQQRLKQNQDYEHITECNRSVIMWWVKVLVTQSCTSLWSDYIITFFKCQWYIKSDHLIWHTENLNIAQKLNRSININLWSLLLFSR